MELPAITQILTCQRPASQSYVQRCWQPTCMLSRRLLTHWFGTAKAVPWRTEILGQGTTWHNLLRVVWNSVVNLEEVTSVPVTVCPLGGFHLQRVLPCLVLAYLVLPVQCTCKH